MAKKCYLTEIKPKIIEDNKNNVQNDTMGNSQLEQYKIQTFRELRQQLATSSSPYCYIHKLQIRTKINKEHYHEMSLTTKGKTKAKYHTERINHTLSRDTCPHRIGELTIMERYGLGVSLTESQA